MKISDLRFTERKWDFVKPFHIANSVSSSKVNIEVELVLADGTIGLGESSSSFRVTERATKASSSFVRRCWRQLRDWT